MSLATNEKPAASQETQQWQQIGDDIDGSGRSVAVSADGSTIVVHALFDDGNGERTSRVRAFRLLDGAWVQVGADIDDGATSIAVSADGSTVVTGDRSRSNQYESVGRVRVHRLLDGAWVQVGADIDGDFNFHNLGSGVAVSADGGTIGVGATGWTVDGGHFRVYRWDDSSWVQVGADIEGGDFFSGSNFALSADGTSIVIEFRTVDATRTKYSYARVLRWDGSSWVQAGSTLVGEIVEDGRSNSVALSADGNTKVIGARPIDGNGDRSGHVRVYRWNGSSWVQVGADIDGDDNFGASVAVSADGRTVLVGAADPFDSRDLSGYARVFRWDDSSWVQVGDDIGGGESNNNLGSSVAVSADGKTVVVGDNAGSGVVRVFRTDAISVELCPAGTEAAGQPRIANDANCDGIVRVGILGDSYISGEGTGQFIEGTDTAVVPIDLPFTVSNECHRSELSWAYMVALELTGDQKQNIDFLACSGATTHEMWNANGDTRGREPAQLLEFKRRHEERKFDVVLTSLGGNDALFSDTVTMCVVGVSACSSAVDRVERIPTEVAPAVADVLRTLRFFVGEDVPIFHMGYPDPLRPTGLCAGVSHAISDDVTIAEQEWLSQEFLREVNDQGARAASAAGVNFVDSRSWFEGHSICAPNDAVRFANGLRLGNDILFLEADTFHPTVEGYEEMAKRFRALHMSAGALTTRTNPQPDEGVLGTNNNEPSSSITITFNGDGEPIAWGSGDQVITITDAEPGTVVVVTQFSVPVRLGEGVVAADGSLSFDLEIPYGTPAGYHTIELTTASGYPLSAVPILVEVPTNCQTESLSDDLDGDGVRNACDPTPKDGPLSDPDGDGIANAMDNCPLVPNMNQEPSDGGVLGAACELGSAGADIALAPNETPSLCQNLMVTVNLALGETPTAGDDVIRGTAGNDVINAGGGNDVICGLQGDDIINGGDGFDKVFAGAGNDSIDGGIGNDNLVGGSGNDTIIGGNGNDRLQGGGGVDDLNGGGGYDRIAGNDGNDILRGGTHDDELFGNLGRDQLFGEGGNDVLRGGAWVDIMNGGAGSNDGCTLTDPGGLTETRTNCEGGVFGR